MHCSMKKVRRIVKKIHKITKIIDVIIPVSVKHVIGIQGKSQFIKLLSFLFILICHKMLRKLHITDGTSYENPGILAFPNINKNYMENLPR